MSFILVGNKCDCEKEYFNVKKWFILISREISYEEGEKFAK